MKFKVVISQHQLHNSSRTDCQRDHSRVVSTTFDVLMFVLLSYRVVGRLHCYLKRRPEQLRPPHTLRLVSELCSYASDLTLGPLIKRLSAEKHRRSAVAIPKMLRQPGALPAPWGK